MYFFSDMKVFYLLIIPLLVSCASGANLISSIDKEDNFFLCFPSANNNYSRLSIKEKIEIQKKIVLEKERRNLDCSQFSELLSAEENLKNINQEEMNRRLNKCRYRGEPCRYD